MLPDLDRNARRAGGGARQGPPRAGRVAKLKVSPRFAGELLVTVAPRRCSPRDGQRAGGGATVDIPVGDNWGAGAYVTDALFRPGDAKGACRRAIGVKWLPSSGAKLPSRSAPSPRQAASRCRYRFGDRAAARHRCVCDGYSSRPRHPQPHQLPGPDPEAWFSASASSASSCATSQPPDRWLAGATGKRGPAATAQMASNGGPPTEAGAFFSGP